MNIMHTISHGSIQQLCRRIVSLNRTAKIVFMVAADLIALPVCFFAAMVLRGGDLELAAEYSFPSYLLVAALTIAIFSLSDLYRAVIRFVDQRLLSITGLSMALAILCAYLTMLMLHEEAFPRSVLAIYWFIGFSYVVASRVGMRNFLRKQNERGLYSSEIVAIYGAGDTGARLAETMRNCEEYRPVCFFDDKSALSKRNIGGLRVFNTERLVEIVNSMCIRSIVIALPSVSPARLRHIMQRLSYAGVSTRILSRLVDLAEDKSISHDAIRALKFEDLLGRSPVPPRADLFARCVQGKTVLVTGAGGSIGSELCRQIGTLMPDRLHLLDHCEFALYTIRQELMSRFPKLRLEAHLGSVCNADLVERIVRDGKINTIYHAAAYKHVPLVELNIAEGMRNNVLGAQTIATQAGKHCVGTCVLISSDKAVRPTNTMGASKRIAELIFQAAAVRYAPTTTFSMVRFGNVLGSSGSVIPLFQHQIACGGPITITHPEVTRYFMLIPEAAQLVIQAGAMAKGGDVFVLDMGEAVKIVDLARSLIALSGLTERTQHNPDGDIEVSYIGLFPGEKLHEELLTDGEVFPSEHPRIMRMKEKALRANILETLTTCLMMACETNDRAVIESMTRAIVPEYSPQHTFPPPKIESESQSNTVGLGIFKKFIPFRS
jgi:FlaA1/EpsC-like NDP-sugar epimerase